MTHLSRRIHRYGRAPLAGRRGAGFTLIELMIAVAIIAILAAIALPNYQAHVIKTRRAAAAACALEAAQFMERFYTTNLRYDRTRPPGNVAVALPQGQCAQDVAAHYTIQLSTAAGKAVTSNSYSIEAVPVAGSAQETKDTKCATLSFDQTGKKTVSNTATAPSECW